MYTIKKSLFIFLFMSSAVSFGAEDNPEQYDYLDECAKGNKKIVVRLLQKKSPVRLQTKTNNQGKTGLMLAAENGHHSTLDEILSLHTKEERCMQSPVTPEQKQITEDAGSARWWADREGHEKCVTLLQKYR